MPSPLQAIRRYCAMCASSAQQVAECEFTDCALYPYRQGKTPRSAHYRGQAPEQFSPLRAIRRKCLDCMNGQPKEVRLCPSQDCVLWPFRFGKRPATQKRPVPLRLALPV